MRDFIDKYAQTVHDLNEDNPGQALDAIFGMVAEATLEIGDDIDEGILPHRNLITLGMMAKELLMAIYRIRQLEEAVSNLISDSMSQAKSIDAVEAEMFNKLHPRDDYQADVMNTITNRLIAVENKLKAK